MDPTIFEKIEDTLAMQEYVYANLPGENQPEVFGYQVVANEKDEVLDFNNRLLIASTALTAHSIVSTIHYLGGLSIASHVDKDVFSIISQLGFIPKELIFDALEMSPHISRENAEQLFMDYNSYTWVSSSDAHHLSDIGRRTTTFVIKEPSLAEIRMALRGIEGRKVEWK